MVIGVPTNKMREFDKLYKENKQLKEDLEWYQNCHDKDFKTIERYQEQKADFIKKLEKTKKEIRLRDCWKHHEYDKIINKLIKSLEVSK